MTGLAAADKGFSSRGFFEAAHLEAEVVDILRQKSQRGGRVSQSESEEEAADVCATAEMKGASNLHG